MRIKTGNIEIEPALLSECENEDSSSVSPFRRNKCASDFENRSSAYIERLEATKYLLVLALDIIIQVSTPEADDIIDLIASIAAKQQEPANLTPNLTPE